MKRDMDLVRKILLACEEVPAGKRLPQQPVIDGYAKEEIGYHIHLMGEAGLLKVTNMTFMESPSPQAAIISVTWRGHEFADASKSSAVWEGTKKAMAKLGGAGFDVTLEVMKEVGKQKLKELGFDIP